MYIDGRHYHQPEIRATFIQTLHFWMAMKVRTGGGCSCREVKMDEVKSMNTISQQSSGSKAQPRTFVATFFPCGGPYFWTGFAKETHWLDT